MATQYEEDAGTTSWRHTNTDGVDGPHLDAMRKLDFVIRSVSTIGNYGDPSDCSPFADGVSRQQLSICSRQCMANIPLNICVQ